jgi:hypothetical protein
MPQQKNQTVIFGQRREYELVTANKQLVATDTGKWLHLSNSAGMHGTAGQIALSVPAIADMKAGFNVKVTFGSNHSHSVDGMDQRGSGSIGGPGFGTVQTVSSMGVSTITVPADGEDGFGLRKAQWNSLDLFWDGSTWHVTGLATYGFFFT